MRRGPLWRGEVGYVSARFLTIVVSVSWIQYLCTRVGWLRDGRTNGEANAFVCACYGGDAGWGGHCDVE